MKTLNKFWDQITAIKHCEGGGGGGEWLLGNKNPEKLFHSVSKQREAG